MRKAVWAAAVAVGAHAGPALTTVPPLRARLAPGLSGFGRRTHVALTFDDGPDPDYTPAVLDRLDTLGVRATFFLLGTQTAKHPTLARDLAAAGHEIGLHGYEHRSLLRRSPYATHRDLTRGCEVIEDLTGMPIRWWRPPYGILTGAGIVAAHRLGLTPVLWTAWGRDWTANATAESVLATVRRGLRPGGTILLHDSDCTSAPGSSAATVAALPQLVREIRGRGLEIGSLREHMNG
ncbi:MAG TPA: polysaccharide deacetylase family protein [Micromonosporaceae bacterium]|nr:polysaccharide deacetylase family protein [Micromonosporaceae bacterium]